MWLFNKKINSSANKDMPESFSVLQGQRNGRPFLATINMASKNYEYKKEYPWCLGISIEFKKPTANGLATAKELKELEPFEDKFCDLIASKGKFQYIGASNWYEHRELIFYTTDPKELAVELQKMMDSKPEWLFNFMGRRDPKWKQISVFLKSN